MNAFVLLTSAWLAGADPAPAAAPIHPIHPGHAAPAVVSTGSGCGASYGGCGASGGDAYGDSCCDTGRQRKKLFGRLKGRRNRGDDCCETSCAPAPVCKPACPPPCPPKPVCCAPAPACPPAPSCNADPCCDDHGRRGLFGKRKGKSGRKRGGDDCCHDAYGGVGASGCGGGNYAPVPAPVGPIPGVEPKKMPTTIGGSPSPFTPAKNGAEF